jgi:hypothetical protein
VDKGLLDDSARIGHPPEPVRSAFLPSVGEVRAV